MTAGEALLAQERNAEMQIEPIGATIPGATHHRVTVNGTELHYVAAGKAGEPILLVHGFPETWWAFHRVMPLLAARHRVFAVDLRGFGDSAAGPGPCDSRTMANDLQALIAEIGLTPMHVVGQDISGGTVFRLAATCPSLVASLTAIEMGLAGFGLEALADVSKGGAWHIGMLAAEGVADMLLAGKEREFLSMVLRPMMAKPSALDDRDIAEFARTYARPNGWRGASGLYASMLGEGNEMQVLAEERRLQMPVLAIGAGGGAFTADTMKQVSEHDISVVTIGGAGHYVALEAPDEIAAAITGFVEDASGRRRV